MITINYIRIFPSMDACMRNRRANGILFKGKHKNCWTKSREELHRGPVCTSELHAGRPGPQARRQPAGGPTFHIAGRASG